MLKLEVYYNGKQKYNLDLHHNVNNATTTIMRLQTEGMFDISLDLPEDDYTLQVHTDGKSKFYNIEKGYKNRYDHSRFLLRIEDKKEQ